MFKNKLFRTIQLTIAIVLFVITFIVCYTITDFKLTEIQLSKWGIVKSTSIYWNGTLIILAISSYINIRHHIDIHPELKYKKTFINAFAFECMNIATLGLIPAGFLLHTIIAYTYFFTTPLLIYIFAFINRNAMKYMHWMIHSVTAALMMIIPLIAYHSFTGHAIAEIIHSVIFIAWNYYILKIH
jgi:hypothetical protein